MTQNLITRLSKLDAPDREVDAEIALQNGWQVFPGDNWIGPEGKIVVPEYTRSVDAAVSLAERMLPGANVLMGWGQTKETKPWARIGVIPSHDATGFNLAIALLIALLRAKEASNGQ